MQYHFEIYIIGDSLTKEHWIKFYRAILQYGGLLCRFHLTFTCTDNVVRFFVSSDKDLSMLSNNIEGLLLRPAAETDFSPPETSAKERFINFVGGGNILDLKEKLAVKKSKDLQHAVFRVRCINTEKAVVSADLYFNAAGLWSKASKKIFAFPAQLFAVDFTTNTRYLKKTMPKYLNIEKSLHMLMSDNVDSLFEIDTFPYFSHNYYLNITNYEFDKHSFIIGATGSGKSKFIGLYVDRLYRTALKMNYRIIIIDPHASLAADFEYLPDTRVVNFNSESTELFSETAGDISAATELTATLFKSLLADQFNAQLDRTLRFSLFVLLTAQNMSLDNLKRFLTDLDLRTQILSHVTGYVPQNIIQFFGSDFNEIRTKNYQTAILPVVSLVDELQLQPTLVKGGDVSMAKTIQDHFLTVFSLNKVSMGEKTVKTVAGLLIQQIFLLAQSRAFSQKVILIVDEVSVVQNPALSSILAEARKFGLSVILTQQYFGQIEKDLQDAIFANVYNYYVFRVSEEDARALEGNLNIELPKEIVEAEHKKGHKEADLRVKIMTELHPRECLIRLSANGQINPALKARTADAVTMSHPEASQDPNKLAPYEQTLPTKFVEGTQLAAQPAAADLPAAPQPDSATLPPPLPVAQSTAPQPQPQPPAQPEASESIHLPAGVIQASEGYGPTAPEGAPTGPVRGFSLSELLAQQSSGRKRQP
jgi:hypothetical protein